MGCGVELASIWLMPVRSRPMTGSMSLRLSRSAATRPLAALALLAGAAVLGGCGTPAVLKPTATPLPGLKHDIQAAQNAVAQSQQQAYGSTTVTTP
jgi:hypothetical protein